MRTFQPRQNRAEAQAPPVQRAAVPSSPPAEKSAHPAFTRANASRSGRPLDPAARGRMGARLGHNFGHVRVHTDAAAASAAAGWRARAFTLNHDIYFAEAYEPSTPDGDNLLAHELTHVIQSDAALSDSARPCSSVASLELEAERVADAFRLGVSAPPVRGVARGLSLPLRQGDDEDPGAPTFGNLSRDNPKTGFRLRLQQTGGKWYEIIPGRESSKRRAAGWYDFVMQDGEMWAEKGKGPYGHTEAAQGGRVKFAGQIRFTSHSGQIAEWNDGSGHYLPSKVFAGNAGLPLDKFKPHPERSQMVQLPVFQPNTKPPGGGGTTEAKPPAITPEPTTPKPSAVTPPEIAPPGPAVPLKTQTAGASRLGPTSSTTSRELAKELMENAQNARRMANLTQALHYGLTIWSAASDMETAAKAIQISLTTLNYGSPYHQEIQAAFEVAEQAKEVQAYYTALDLVVNQMPGEGDPEWNRQGSLYLLANNYHAIDYDLREALKAVKGAQSNLNKQLDNLQKALNERIMAATFLPKNSLVHGELLLFIDAAGKMVTALRNARDSYADAQRSLEFQRRMTNAAIKRLEARIKQIDTAGELEWNLREMGVRDEDARLISEQVKSLPLK